MSATNPGLDALRNLTRYRTHGGYAWAAVMDDGECVCVPCLRENYRQVFAATRDGARDGWRVTAAANSGDAEETEHCAHCNRIIWEVST